MNVKKFKIGDRVIVTCIRGVKGEALPHAWKYPFEGIIIAGAPYFPNVYDWKVKYAEKTGYNYFMSPYVHENDMVSLPEVDSYETQINSKYRF